MFRNERSGMKPLTADLAKQVALSASELQRQRTGHAPHSVTVVISEDTLVITLFDALTPAEKALSRSREGAAQVQEFHRQLFATSIDEMRQEIKRITGMGVREATADIEPATGAVVQAFTTGTVVQVFSLDGKSSTEVWSGNDSNSTEKEWTKHAASELRGWLLKWLDGDNGQVDDASIVKLKELRSCNDELPAGYCQHGRLHLPFGASYGVAAQKILGNTD